jgi:hypothetical protein
MNFDENNMYFILWVIAQIFKKVSAIIRLNQITFSVYLTRCFTVSTTTDTHFRLMSWIMTIGYPSQTNLNLPEHKNT